MAGGTRWTRKANGCLAKSHPRNHAAQESVALGHLQERVDDIAAHQAEIPCVWRQVRMHQTAHEAIKCECGSPLEECFSNALLSLGVNHVEPFLVLPQHLVDE